jgi:hypothetical protein
MEREMRARVDLALASAVKITHFDTHIDQPNCGAKWRQNDGQDPTGSSGA